MQADTFAGQFFKQALCTQGLAHAYVLKGPHLAEMYQTAMDVAAALNCSNQPEPGAHCGQCQNCRWIASNAHPAVTTVSPLTYLVSEQGDAMSEEALTKLFKKKSAPTTIKSEQINYLINQLGRSSDYYRVVIFTGAEEVAQQSGQEALANTITAPFEWRNLSLHQDKQFRLLSLDPQTLREAPANKFLKTLEEPPARVLFFFLTTGTQKLMDTIVSRCQVLPFKGQGNMNQSMVSGSHAQFFEAIRSRINQRGDFYSLVQQFEQQLVAEEGLTPIQAIDVFQHYLKQDFHQQTVTPERFNVYKAWQQKLDLAKRMLQAKTHEEQTLNHLFFELQQL